MKKLMIVIALLAAKAHDDFHKAIMLSFYQSVKV